MEKELLMKEVYDAIDLCRLGSLDGEVVEMIIRPGKEANTREVSIRLSNDREVESFDFTFTNGESFDKETMKELTDYFLGEEEIKPVEEYYNPLISDLSKVVVKANSGNNILIETKNAGSLKDDFFTEKVETVTYEPDAFDDFDKKVELALECAKGRLQLRDYIDEIAPTDKEAIIKIVKSVGVKDLKEYVLTNFKELPENAATILLQDLNVPNPKLVPTVSLFLKNEARFEKYDQDLDFQDLLKIAINLSKKGYFTYSLDFPRGFLFEELKDAENTVKKGSRNKYNFLREMEENFLKVSNPESAFLVSKFKNYLVKKKQRSLAKLNPVVLTENKEETQVIKKSDNFIDSNSFDDLKATLDLMSGGKLDTEKMQLVIKNNLEDKEKREVSMFLKDGISKDTYNFRFNDGESFDKEVLPKLIDYFISKEDNHEVEYRDLFGLNNYNLTTTSGNSMFVSTSVDITPYINIRQEASLEEPEIGVEKTSDFEDANSNEVTIDRNEVEEYYRMDFLRQNGQLPPIGLNRITELVINNDVVRELEDSRKEYLNKEISKEEYDAKVEHYREVFNIAKDPLMEDTLGTTETVSIVKNKVKEVNLGQREAMEINKDEMAEYYHIDSLRQNGQLPPVGLNRIIELAENNDLIRELEVSRKKYLNNEISKEEYDAKHKHYRDLFDKAKDSLIDDNPEIKTNVSIAKNELKENTLEQQGAVETSIDKFKNINKNEAFEYFGKNYLRGKGQLSSSGLDRITELAENNDLVRELENSREEYISGKISQEKYDEIYYGCFGDLCAAAKEAEVEEMLETAKAVETTVDEIKRADLEQQKITNQVIEYFDKDDLRNNGELSASGLERITELAEMNTSLGWLEDIRNQYLSGELSKEDYESNYNFFRTIFFLVRDPQRIEEQDIVTVVQGVDLKPSEQEVVGDDRDINQAISESVSKHLEQVEQPLDDQPSTTLLERVKEAYELASSSSTKDDPAGIRVHHIKNENDVEIIVSKGMTSDEVVLFQEKASKDAVMSEFSSLVQVYIDDNSIALNTEQGYNSGKNKNLVSILNDGRFLQISNGSAAEVDTYHDIIKQEMIVEKGEDKGHGKN